MYSTNTYAILSDRTKKNLQEVGYNELTSIQEKVIPIILEGKDIIAQSRTGTGKTAGFVIPIGEKLEISSNPQVLILAPTRELALQVSEETKKLTQYNKLRVLAVYGKDSMERQLRFFRQGVDIVVGTPGRVTDHIERKSFRTDNLKFLVLDEADEMIDKGFLPSIEWIIKKIPSDRQTLLFSATITSQVAKFSQTYLRNPVKVSGETENLPENNIKHYYLETAPRQKDFHLINFLRLHSSELIIIFANTKKRVELIEKILSQEGLKVDYIHSDLSQPRRTRVFNKFRAKQIKILIATDVAARGLHVNDISYVINYDFPQSNELYIHRVGRTGRAGAEGSAITFISSVKSSVSKKSVSKEKNQLMAVARQKKYHIEPLNLPGQNQIDQILEDKLLTRITKIIDLNEPNKNEQKIKKLTEKYGAEKLAATLFDLLTENDRRGF